ncbi:hypothetical protein AZI87_01995 [Bdellovibrio bacteriovorus]|uniref:Uncharacterized protein n=1 Tax=Bdellovibrio bacteriovorus TaxID=959 RepID=A0A162GG07_BDEBC|nr:hypothetical protein AZI87_01995 [Bdellovibrio bacteriovorus]
MSFTPAALTINNLADISAITRRKTWLLDQPAQGAHQAVALLAELVLRHLVRAHARAHHHLAQADQALALAVNPLVARQEARRVAVTKISTNLVVADVAPMKTMVAKVLAAIKITEAETTCTNLAVVVADQTTTAEKTTVVMKDHATIAAVMVRKENHLVVMAAANVGVKNAVLQEAVQVVTAIKSVA